MPYTHKEYHQCPYTHKEYHQQRPIQVPVKSITNSHIHIEYMRRILHHKILQNSQIREHQGRSIHTGRPLASPPFSNIRNHAEEHNHPLLNSDFKIIASFPDRLTLLLAESMTILSKKPSLNNMLTSYPLNFN